MANCKICGNQSGFFPLCKKCNDLKEEGKIIKCEECEDWHYKNKLCSCQNENTDFDTSECIICNQESNGYLFCKNCFFKYKNKEILLKISNCKDIELLNIEYGGKRYNCDDGHIVRSLGELLIDNYLYQKDIKHTYEKELKISEEQKITPDWYLPNLNLYIEHWGISNSKKYNEQKNFKLKYYNENNKTIICTHEDDLHNLSSELEMKLNPKNFKENKVNFLKENK